ncbi:FtsW/RodA/SpoVE family cell cycle protein [Salimicrobium sp. PL1-032A]|uniref:FtsW/RodA/SpoVE family cell cycle protein n=1 Tax=Salimicrobium sp. PL1-032A TaxID=3095364 RepID=UPI0032601EA2
MRWEERFDWQLFFAIIGFIAVSCIALYSAQQSEQYNDPFVLKQLVFYGLGFFVIAFMMYFDPDLYQKASIYLYIFGLLLLIALIFAPPSIAPVIKGQKSWFAFPGLSIQPSEFMKIFTIMMLANVVSKHNDTFRGSALKSDFLLLGKIVGVTGIPLVLIMQQPDLGTSLVFIAIMVGMILISGVRWRVILPLYTGIAALGTSIILFALGPGVSRKIPGSERISFRANIFLAAATEI